MTENVGLIWKFQKSNPLKVKSSQVKSNVRIDGAVSNKLGQQAAIASPQRARTVAPSPPRATDGARARRGRGWTCRVGGAYRAWGRSSPPERISGGGGGTECT
jgi:hypothetical protein